MAKKITDDLTGEEIDYPFLSVASIRVELSPTRYAWLGADTLKFFKDGKNLAEWVDEEVQDTLEAEEDRSY